MFIISHTLIKSIKMTHPSKRKIKVKKQERNDNGTFAKKSRIVNDWNDDYWGDEDDSGWDEDSNGWDEDSSGWNEVDLLNDDENKYKLVWSNNAHLEQKKRGPYLTGKIKKSTYFDKYGLSGSFTKAAKGTTSILTLINKHRSTPDDFSDILDNTEDEEQNGQLDLKKKLKI